MHQRKTTLDELRMPTSSLQHVSSFPRRSERRLRKKLQRRRLHGLLNRKWIVALISVLGVLCGFLFSMAMTKTYQFPIEQLDRLRETITIPKTRIYNEKGRLIAQFGGKQHEYIKLGELQRHNKLLIDAVLKVEDHRFKKHNGIDYYSLGRAIAANIVDPGSEGASTITMQVCKNIILKNASKDLKRKLAEFQCAFQMERNLTKERILELYLNYINFGGDITGVQMASKVYLKVDLTQQALTLDQVALLAGMPKAPSIYHPIQQPKQAVYRRNVVLLEILPKEDDMPALITEAEAKVLKSKPLGVNKAPIKKDPQQEQEQSEYEKIIQPVMTELKFRFNLTEKDLLSKAYKIYTNDDKNQVFYIDKIIGPAGEEVLPQS